VRLPLLFVLGRGLLVIGFLIADGGSYVSEPEVAEPEGVEMRQGQQESQTKLCVQFY
jgi:hypothetical protein